MHPTPADPHHPLRTRRRFLRAAMWAGATAAAGRAHAVRAADATLVPTPPNALGPFYPPRKPADSDADLTQVAGQAARARGTILYVTGRVVDLRGKPIAGAELELWQANAFGRYLHPADGESSGPLDPGFQGYGRLATAADGTFRIKTIKPPPYSARTPHIHFNVAGGGARLTTQMFFEGEAMNERDSLYRYLGADDRRASTGRYAERSEAMEPGALAVVWDIVLRA